MTSSASSPYSSDALRTPPRAGTVRVVPLGGLGEIGMNCLALEQEDGIIVVDCGITFPDDDTGIDTYHPDLAYLYERKDRVAGLFLTHGHEDHVGGLPHFLRKLKVPVFGPPHALAVGRHRLVDRGFDPLEFQLHTVRTRTAYRVGPFQVEPVRVTHSITDATALAIRTAAGIVLHTGDFRFDPTPPDGEVTDEERFAELGREGVRLMLSDSTGIDAQGPHESEATVGRMLEQLIGDAKGRVVVAMFASNVQRLKTVGEICMRLGRKIALFGRSISLQAQWGQEIGRLAWPSDLIVPPTDVANMPADSVVVLAGGTQAEQGSALMRLATRTHP
ncbi:MAG TPA: ribonuclease J, partial [Polyangiaceae bacterium]